jgi:hypothetical protein
VNRMRSRAAEAVRDRQLKAAGVKSVQCGRRRIEHRPAMIDARSRKRRGTAKPRSRVEKHRFDGRSREAVRSGGQ